MNGIDAMKDDPGLKSVAIAIFTPFSKNLRASG